MKADLLVNQPAKLSEVPKAEAFEAAEDRLEKRRSFPHRQISDLIEARRLIEPPDRSKKFFNSFPRQNPGNNASEAPWASPSPSEVGVYGPTPDFTTLE